VWMVRRRPPEEAVATVARHFPEMTT